jgi:hypothetical protein
LIRLASALPTAQQARSLSTRQVAEKGGNLNLQLRTWNLELRNLEGIS